MFTAGAGGVVHSAVPGHYMRDREPHRSRINAVRDTLKRLNFSRFGTMLEAFRYYDKVKKNTAQKQPCPQFTIEVLVVQIGTQTVHMSEVLSSKTLNS